MNPAPEDPGLTQHRCEQMQTAERDARNVDALKSKLDDLQFAISSIKDQIGQRRGDPGDPEEKSLLKEMEDIQTTSVKIKRQATMQIDRITALVAAEQATQVSPAPGPIRLPPPRPPAPRKPAALRKWEPAPRSILEDDVFSNSPDSTASAPFESQGPQQRGVATPLAYVSPIQSPSTSSTPASSSWAGNQDRLSNEEFEEKFSELLQLAGAQGMGVSKAFSDSVISRASELLTKVGKPAWSERPRTFLVLRVIGEVRAMDTFVTEGYKDIDFPYAPANLPSCVKSLNSRHNFLKTQGFVLNTRIADLVQGGQHRHLEKSADTYFTPIKKLGQGGWSVVDQVRSKLTLQDYARKRIDRTSKFAKDRKALQFFENEIHNLKRLSHQHLVKFVGSYTDKKYVGIIMEPVADTDLRHHLGKAAWTPDELSTLRTFVGCLGSAITYLHENKCRHKDLKPHNILIKDDTIYVADFGIALDWTESDRETTMGRPEAYTELYVAPEVGMQQPRNSAADIWSLGCIFLEMCTILCGKSLEDKEDFFVSDGRLPTGYWRNQELISKWLDVLESTSQEDKLLLDFSRAMTSAQPTTRPKATDLITQLIEHKDTGLKYCKPCCIAEAASDETSWQGSEAEEDDIFETAKSDEVTKLTALSQQTTQSSLKSPISPVSTLSSIPSKPQMYRSAISDTAILEDEVGARKDSKDSPTRTHHIRQFSLPYGRGPESAIQNENFASRRKPSDGMPVQAGTDSPSLQPNRQVSLPTRKEQDIKSPNFFLRNELNDNTKGERSKPSSPEVSNRHISTPTMATQPDKPMSRESFPGYRDSKDDGIRVSAGATRPFSDSPIEDTKVTDPASDVTEEIPRDSGPACHTTKLRAMEDGSHIEAIASPNLQFVFRPQGKRGDTSLSEETEEIVPLEADLEETFLKDHRRFEDLLVQIRSGDFAGWKSKLTKFVNPIVKDTKGYNILLVAVSFENDFLARDVAEFAIQELPELASTSNVFGNTPIHYAAAKNRTMLMKYLAKYGAPLDTVNARKQTPLHVAARAGNTQAVDYLLRNASVTNKINSKDDSGRSPLHVAIQMSTPVEMVKDLIKAGADPSLKDESGQSPKSLSAESANFAVMMELHPDGPPPPPPLGFYMDDARITSYTAKALEICRCEACLLVRAVNTASLPDPQMFTKCPCSLHLGILQKDVLGDEIQLTTLLSRCKCQTCILSRDITDRVTASALPGCACSRCTRARGLDPLGELPPLPPLPPFGAPFSPFDMPPPGFPPYGYGRDRGLGMPPYDPLGVPPFPPDPRLGDPFRDPYRDPYLNQFGLPDRAGPLPTPYDIPLIPYMGHETMDMMIEDADRDWYMAGLEDDPYMRATRQNEAVATLSNAGFKGKNSYRMNPDKAYLWTMANMESVPAPEIIIELLLGCGTSVEKKDKDGCTCLHIAARHNKIKLAKLLIGRRAKVDVPRDANFALKSLFTPLRYALYFKNDLMMRLLLKNGANVNDQSAFGRLTYLHECCYQPAAIGEFLPLFIAHGADVNLKDDNSGTPLHIAVMNGLFFAAEALLDAGADIEAVATKKDNSRPLRLAIEWGHLRLVELLLQRGANVHARCGIRAPNALFLAVQGGSGAIVDYLLRSSSAIDDIQVKDTGGRTVLHILANSSVDGIIDIVGPLIMHGADINAEDSTGNTPLHEAAKVGSTILVNELRMLGASPHAQNRQGKTPLDLAQAKKHREVVELLGGKLKKRWFGR